MAVYGEFTTVIAVDTKYDENNDNSTIKFSTGGRKTGAAKGDLGAVCMLDYSWAAVGNDSARVFINDEVIATIRATDNKQHAGRIIPFNSSLLADGKDANRFRLDIDSPNPNLSLTLHSVVVFFHQ